MKLKLIITRFEYEWQLLEVQAIQSQAAKDALEDAAKVCRGVNSTYHENDPLRCSNAIRAIKVEQP